MRVLLTGATGFVGRHVAARLRSAPGVETVPLARVDLARIRHGAMCELLEKAEPGAVINCVGAVSGDAARLVAGNVTAVSRLAGAMASAVPGARLVHVGSAAEYGAHRVPVTEDAECRPLGHYGLTKLAGTELVRSAARDGVDAVVLRLFNPVGPGAPPTSLTGRLVAGLRGGGPLSLGATGDVRDFIDVRDAAAALVAAALAPGPLPDLLNLGSGRPTPVKGLIDLMLEVAGAAPGTVSGSVSDEVQSPLPWSCADVSRLTSALNFRPEYDLRSSMEAAWQD